MPRSCAALLRLGTLVAGAALVGTSVASPGRAGAAPPPSLPPAVAPDSWLDFEQAVALALARNERAREADEQLVAAEARVERARAFFFPDLNASGGVRRARGDLGGTPVGTVGASLVLFDARSIPLYRQAARERDAARYQTSDDQRRLAFEAADAFLLTIGLEQVRNAAIRRVEFAAGSLQDARARVAAGLAGSNDVTRAELERATSDRALADAQAAASNAVLELGNLLDSPIADSLVSPEALLDSAAGMSPDPEPFIVAALRRRPDLLASRKHALAAHEFAREPLLRALPNFWLSADAAFSDPPDEPPRGGDWLVGVNFSWPLYDGGERYAVRHERLALSRVADLQARALGREVELELRRSGVTLAQSQASLRAADAALAAARQNAAEISELYRQGLARALEVADAGVRLFEAEVGLVSERVGLGRAFLEWRQALGLDPLGRQP